MMRLIPWRKSLAFQMTAVAAVGLVLQFPVHPAAASVAPPSSRAPGRPAPPSSPPPLAASKRPTPDLSTSPAQAPLPRVALPTMVTVVDAAGTATPAQEAWSAFDGVAGTRLASPDGAPIRLRVALAGRPRLESVAVSGATGTLSLYAAAGTPQLVAARKVTDAGPWTRVALTAPAALDALVLEWTPSQKGGALPDVRLWALGDAATSPDRLADALVTGAVPGAVEFPASPASQDVARLSFDEREARFDVDLETDPRLLDRAFLVYELEGLVHWTAAVREINGQRAQGGFSASRKGTGGRQVEEIAAAWLRPGRNTIRFLAPEGMSAASYRVRDLRIVGAPAQTAALPREPQGAARSLFDGDDATGWSPKVKEPRKPFVLGFDRPKQPHALSFKLERAGAGTLVVTALDRGRASRQAKVAVDLDDFGPGWHHVPLDAALPVTDDVRVAFLGGREGGGLVSALRVTGSEPPRAAGQPSLTVSHPLHGECVDGAAYVRGFARVLGAAAPKLFQDGRPVPGPGTAPDGAFGFNVEEPVASKGKPWQVHLDALYPDGSRASTTVAVGPCLGKDAVSRDDTGRERPLIEDVGAPFGETVRAREAKTISCGGATLEIPAGAVDRDVRITLRPLPAKGVQPTDKLTSNVTPGRQAFRLEPHNLTFRKPIKLSLPIDRRLIPAGMTAADVHTFYFDEARGRWTLFESRQPCSNAACPSVG